MRRMEAARPSAPDAVRPFLKWAGGKRQLLPELLAQAPASFGTYFEPFVGGGALFFALRPRRAVLADTNERLIRTYRGVRDSVEEVIRLLRRYPYEETFFYQLRAIDIDACPDQEVAAWFIYMNRACFNGLYRVNRENRFNVSFGRYTNPTICDADSLRECARVLRDVSLEVADFADATRTARRGDFVYFDPPYVPVSITSSFTSYTADGFDGIDHERLRDAALAMKRRGVQVLVSSSSAPIARSLFRRSFSQREVLANRAVNSKAERRGAVTELLFW